MINLFQKSFIEKLTELTQNRALVCEVCLTQEWAVSDTTVTPFQIIDSEVKIGGGPSFPQMMLVCKKCGNTKYFNTVVMGLTEGSKDIEDTAAEQKEAGT